jgi:hypothetical protein
MAKAKRAIEWAKSSTFKMLKAELRLAMSYIAIASTDTALRDHYLKGAEGCLQFVSNQLQGIRAAAESEEIALELGRVREHLERFQQ